MRSLDPQLPVVDVRTFEQVIDRSVGKQRAASALLAVLGGIALLLAALGIYGVMSHATMLRAKKYGSSRTIFASGLRNTIGFGWEPGSGALWGVTSEGR